jgi:sulfate transport system permease protein
LQLRSPSGAAALERRPSVLPRLGRAGGPLGLGIVTLYLSVIVLLPLAAVFAKAGSNGFSAAWDVITSKEALATLELTLVVSLVVTAINAVLGTVIAWVLVRDKFPGQRLVNSTIDLPFALPTVVAGVTLLALYGSNSPVGVNLAYTRIAIVIALLFVTLPFVVRAVQPVLTELDTEAEEAAASLGASGPQIVRKVILPALRPAILAGAALAFARAIGEFGSIVLISGNIPLKTEVASVHIYGLVESQESGPPTAAAALSVVLLLTSLLVLVLVRAIARRGVRQ